MSPFCLKHVFTQTDNVGCYTNPITLYLGLLMVKRKVYKILVESVQHGKICIFVINFITEKPSPKLISRLYYLNNEVRYLRTTVNGIVDMRADF